MLKISKLSLIGFVIILTFLFACSKKKPPKPEPIPKWTILGYFDGNNSQDQSPVDDHSYVIKDLQELERVGSTDQVQILVMLGSFKKEGKCKYYHVQKQLIEPPDPDSIRSEVVSDLGTPDMSDPKTLMDFISFGMQKYPAEHYMLILNDHGGGWRGLCSDTINGDKNWMTPYELSSALSGFYFDLILFYAPSMATLEVAYQIKEKAKYMIASQFKRYPDNILGAAEPENTGWLPYLTQNPNVGIWQFSERVNWAIFVAAQNISTSRPFHSVLIQLSEISNVATSVSNLRKSLIGNTDGYWAEVWKAWESSHTYDVVDSNLVHLRRFAIQIQNQPNLASDSAIKTDAQEMQASVNTAVVDEYMNPPGYLQSGFGGISIHLPWNQHDFDSINYAQLEFCKTTYWDEFISVFIQTYLGNYAGTLNIRSNPTGAKIFLNGVDTGYETNAIITGLFPGFYKVKLTKADYKDFTFPQITLAPRETRNLNANLIPGTSAASYSVDPPSDNLTR